MNVATHSFNDNGNEFSKSKRFNKQNIHNPFNKAVKLNKLQGIIPLGLQLPIHNLDNSFFSLIFVFACNPPVVSISKLIIYIKFSC